MPPAAPRPARERPEAVDRGFERVIVGVLLGLTGLAALWWGGSWWWRAARADAVSASPAPRAQAALVAPSPRPHRRQTLALGSVPPPGIDAGAEAARPERPRPTHVAYGLEQGHGSESWSNGGAPEQRDFEPRYSVDAGGFDEPPAVAAEAAGAFH